MITVCYIGGAVAGWPGVTHGGCIATVMDESLGRCAVRMLEGQTGVTARLELKYLKPAVTNEWYVVRCLPEIGVEGEGKDGGNKRKRWVEGRLETLDGRVLVEGRGLFVVPKGYAPSSVGGEF